MMKKILLISTALFASANIIAADPVFTFGAKNQDSLADVWLDNGKVYSKNDTNRRFCWQLKGFANDTDPVKLQLVITSPAKSTFSFSGINSVDKTEHQFALIIKPVNGTFLNCWKFDALDPLGKYTLKVNANGVQYPLQTFELKP
ncbi:hypothetical protein [Caviibacterium pharyngocola]|uniref:Uncharacterized protein n=1 Tax=Caviibacterium pharyngocola TaxID=28159 RepID=A0A2M8RU67_9PAST|nr:hypothetical protein [Caviibacterium pharyngocola]PJG82436.1 hypothetical protein CVP04_08865 [Caviibacterium pharyngocola]